MNFGQAITTGFRKYVDFRGTATRPEYWWFVLFTVLVALATAVVDYTIGVSLDQDGFAVFTTLWRLAVLLPGTALVVRRLRDAGYAWGWIFIASIPIAGGIVLLVLLCQQSKRPAFVTPPPTYSPVQ